MALIQLDNQREKRASLRHRRCHAVGPMCRCPLGAGAAAGAAPGAPRARGEPEGTDRHTDILTPTTKADSPRPVPSLPLSPSQRVLPHSPLCAPGHQRPLPAPTASRGALRAPVLCAPAASGAPAAPSALARQPSSRRLIAPRGSDVSQGPANHRLPFKSQPPFPRSTPPCLTMASAFTASPPAGQGSAPSALESVGPRAGAHRLAFPPNSSAFP